MNCWARLAVLVMVAVVLWSVCPVLLMKVVAAGVPVTTAVYAPTVVLPPKFVTARILNVYAVPLVSPVFVRVWNPSGWIRGCRRLCASTGAK